jgi:hypothetical protein
MTKLLGIFVSVQKRQNRLLTYVISHSNEAMNKVKRKPDSAHVPSRKFPWFKVLVYPVIPKREPADDMCPFGLIS